MVRQDDSFFPLLSSPHNRLTQPDLVDPNSSSTELFQILDAHSRDTETALVLLYNERFRRQSVQGFSDWASANAVALHQHLNPQLRARLEASQPNVVTHLLIGSRRE